MFMFWASSSRPWCRMKSILSSQNFDMASGVHVHNWLIVLSRIWACSGWEYARLGYIKLGNFRLGNFQLGYISDLATSDLATFLTWLTWQRLTWHHLTWFLVLVFGFWFLVFGFYRKGGQHMHIKIQITVVSVPHLMLPRFLLRRPTATNNLTTIISDIFIRWSGENTLQDNGWGDRRVKFGV